MKNRVKKILVEKKTKSSRKSCTVQKKKVLNINQTNNKM